MDLVAIGHTVIDRIIHIDGREEVLPGGSAPAVATSAVQLGLETGIVSAVGRDFPRNWIADLQYYGVDTTGLATLDGESTRIDIHYDAGGDASRIDLREGVSARLGPALIPPSYHGAFFAHVCPMPPDIQSAFISAMEGKASLVTLDLNQTYGHLYAKKGLSLFPRLDAVDLTFPNEFEARALVGKDDLESCARVLHERGIGCVVITLGSRGCLVYDGESTLRVPSLDLPIVDPTGCGDAFIGGFLARYAATAEPLASAVAGTALASFAVESPGSWCPRIDPVALEAREAKVRKKLDRSTR
jgi:sugar/nucleoside kinase (ribokinase family)